MVSRALAAPKKLLVMRYRFIGDTVLSMPLFLALRQAFPDAQIDALVTRGSGELLQHWPVIDRLVWLDEPNPQTGKPRTLWQQAQRFRAEGYDTALVLKRSWSSALMALLARIPQRVGFSSEGRGLLLTNRIPYSTTMPEVQSFLSALQPWGVGHGHHPPVFPSPAELLLPAHQHQAQAFWHATREAHPHTRHVGVHCSPSNTEKQWPASFWVSLFSKLLAEKQDLPPLMLHCFGTQQDDATMRGLVAHLPATQHAHIQVHCGRWNLHETVAILQGLDAFIGVDSGPLHLAALCGLPVVACMRPEKIPKWRPNTKHHWLLSTADITLAEAACRMLLHSVLAH